MKLQKVHISQARIIQRLRVYALLIDRMRFTHLSARTSVEAKTKNPRPLTIMYFFVASAAFWRILACNSRFAVQIQVCCHSDGHA
jgi:hypothetical protein